MKKERHVFSLGAIAAIGLMLMIGFGGFGCCVNPVARQISELNEAAASGMVRLIDAGTSTRDQEQRYIKAQADAWKAVKEALK